MTRFYPYMKANIVRAYEEGNLAEVQKQMELYGISQEELMSWVKHFKTAGAAGLKVANVQSVRKMEAQA